ncbi:MAG: MotA/TolQ/ExbB proton channel family protein [Calditrichaceae bacterium]|nr:MotA/TolQ/ExbB proton channel family protein [Calditrichia bacterium]NUQ40531.1 MotA/TolQ/ExbB proton channel family protein [Calditrichaceae bacterium]
MLEIFQKGGIMMYPLALSSVLALAVVAERIWSLRSKKILIPEIVAVLEQVNKFEDFSLARSVCQKFQGPFPHIVVACIDNRDLPADELRVTIEDEGRQQIRKLNRGLGILETVAGVAPLLGLLGTVLGMIKVFAVIQELGVGQAKALSGGISEALITTVVGLFIGIPALIAYNYFTSRSENLTLDIEKYTLMLLNKIIRIRAGAEEQLQLKLR